METIRLQNLTPEVYTDESRDFQILCRLYDSIFNGIKHDADSIEYLTDTRFIKSNVLPLLQTKLGFFSKKNIDDESLRYVLMAFPSMVRNKGSLLAIKQLLNMCLKMNNITASYTINYSDSATIVNGVAINSHTIIIGIDTIISNTDIINELAKYLLPVGFSFYIYFFKNIAELQNIYLNDDVKLLYSSSNLSAQIRGTREYLASEDESRYIDYTMPIPSEELSYDLLGGVDVAWISSVDSTISDKFKGIFESEEVLPSDDISDGDLAIAMIPSETSEEDVLPNVYYYHNSQWNQINFIGNCVLSGSDPDISGAQNYDLACVPYYKKSINPKILSPTYLRYSNNSWAECNFRGVFDSVEAADSLSDIAVGDLIAIRDGVSSYKYCTSTTGGNTWVDLNYKATYSNAKQIIEDYNQSNNLVILFGAMYYIKLDGSWEEFTDSVYMLKKVYITNGGDA